MQIIQGKPISPGYAQGRAVLFGVGELSAPRRTVTAEEVEGEIKRFHTALEDSQRDLLQLQERVQSELGSSEADLFTRRGSVGFMTHKVTSYSRSVLHILFSEEVLENAAIGSIYLVAIDTHRHRRC
jgi:hypothetical protein